MIKRRHLAAVGLIASFVIVLVLFFFLTIHDNPPVRVFSVEITPTTATPGDSVVMRTSWCKYTDVDSSLSTFWKRQGDGLIWGLKQRSANVGSSGCQQSAINLVLPDDIPPGRWQRVNIATYQVNFMAARTVEWRSNYIDVVLEK